MALTIRRRLTLWYTAVLLAVLVVSGSAVYVVESHLRLQDLDAELSRTGDALAASLTAELDEGLGLAEAASEAGKDLVFPGRVLTIHDAAGAPLASEGLPTFAIDPVLASHQSSSTVSREGEDWRLHVRSHRHETVGFYTVVAEPLVRTQAQNALLRRTLMLGLPIALGLAAAGGSWIARRALQPVSLMVAQTGAITDPVSGFRLRVPRPEDELGVLAGSFNELLDRLEGAIRTQRRFMADASHELRTPVSIVRTAAEVALSREPRGEADYRESLGIVAEQARRLGRMVDDMMTLARADAGGLAVAAADLYLDELVLQCVRDAGVLAEERRVVVCAAGAPETPFRGDERLLRQMLMNLLDNAIRHTPPAGRVETRLTVPDGFAEIAVVDTGCGVPAGERERIFERFVRLDPARRGPGGAGLGLPIARCIAEAHGGSLHLLDSGPLGSSFLVRLPGVQRRP